MCCLNYTRKDLNKIAGKETEASIVLTYHNLRYLMRLCQQMREAIEKKTFKAFCVEFTKKLYSLEKDVPKWVVDAFAKVDIDVST